VSTVTSWTDALVRTPRDAVRDVRHLFAFRAAGLRGKSRNRVRVLLVVLALVSVGFMIVPAFVPGAADYDSAAKFNAFEMLLLLPTAYAGFLLLATTSAIASGGGRELIARDQAVAYPISPMVDHLGSLVMAPLNIAWILQCWLLFGLSAFALGPAGLPYGVPMTALWVFFSTALAQVIAWTMEAIRRGPHGLLLARSIVGLTLGASAGAVAAHRMTDVLDRLPIGRVVASTAGAAQEGFTWGWLSYLVEMAGLCLAAVVIGVLPARTALRRMPRDEARLETGTYPARPDQRSNFWALVRIDRASIWRSVPLRRGVVVLAALPGLIAFGGNLEWRMLTILPGLVASGAALLFGINAWCLDGRGALWRDALPVDPSTVFAARTWVLLELLLVSSAATILIAGLRAGPPTPSELTALLCTWLVVALQVVNAALRWSIAHPFPVDLRSARATPAPPLSMVGYSARLAWITTITGLLFSGLALVDDLRASLLFAAPMVVWSTWRLVRAQERWLDPVQRSFVVATVAA